MVIIGDINSNAVFDAKNNLRRIEQRSHEAVLTKLAQLGLCSAYHHTTGEAQGGEATATFYLHRSENKPYHLDHCFIAEKRIKSFKVLNNNDNERRHWLNYSDHMPLVVDIWD